MNNDQRLLEQFLGRHPEIAIPLIEDLEIEDMALLIEDQTPERATTLLTVIPAYKSARVLENVIPEKAVRYIEMMSLTHAETVLRLVEKKLCDRILKGISTEKSKNLKQMLSFAPDQIGAHMEPAVLTLEIQMKVEQSLILIRKGEAVVNPHLFILDENKKLIGYLELNELIVSQSEKSIQSLMKVVPRTVLADMSTKDLLEHWDDSFSHLPVVKLNGEFLGTISRKTLSNLLSETSRIDQSALKASNALGELYLIGLTSLLGSSDPNQRLPH